MNWPEALALVARGRKPPALAAVVGVHRNTAERWLRGTRIPCGWMWRALVIEAGLEDRWPELSAARDAAEKRPGAPRIPEEDKLRRKARRIMQQIQDARIARGEVQNG